jgi:hypothetical protein
MRAIRVLLGITLLMALVPSVLTAGSREQVPIFPSSFQVLYKLMLIFCTKPIADHFIG